jgi:hypothetical protein
MIKRAGKEELAEDANCAVKVEILFRCGKN